MSVLEGLATVATVMDNATQQQEDVFVNVGSKEPVVTLTLVVLVNSSTRSHTVKQETHVTLFAEEKWIATALEHTSMVNVNVLMDGGVMTATMLALVFLLMALELCVEDKEHATEILVLANVILAMSMLQQHKAVNQRVAQPVRMEENVFVMQQLRRWSVHVVESSLDQPVVAVTVRTKQHAIQSQGFVIVLWVQTHLEICANSLAVVTVGAMGMGVVTQEP